MTLHKGDIVFGSMKIDRRVGSGSYGRVFLAKGTGRSRQRYAVKEARSSRISLRTEYDYLKNLRNRRHIKGVPKVFGFNSYHGRDCIAMELLDKSLSGWLDKRRGNLGLQTVCRIGVQLLGILRNVHAYGTLHRDIKPDNVLTGLKDQSKIYLTDFGQAKRYKDSRGRHIKKTRNDFHIGTPMFASANAQMGYELSRRDDLIAMLYTLVYLYRGRLPWSDAKDAKRMIIEKQSTSAEQLTMHMPRRFTKLATDILRLGFYEKPNHSSLNRSLKAVMGRYRWRSRGSFEWMNAQGG